MPRDKRNQLKPEFQGQQNLNPFGGNDSASRKQMAGGNFSQMLPLLKPTLRQTITGTEVEYGKYTFRSKMPANGVVVDVIDDFTQLAGSLNQSNSRSRLVIYEDVDTGEYGCFEMPIYISTHKLFGAPLHNTAEASKVHAGVGFKKDTVFALTSDVHANGELTYGRSTRIAYMTLPGVVEDGIIISESYAKKCQFYCYETRTFSIGREFYPLNLYGEEGDGGSYKFAPGIGERVRRDGILVGLRRHRSEWSSLNMTRARMKKTQRIHDRMLRAQPGAEVVDVSILCNGEQNKTALPSETARWAEQYDAARRRRNAKLIDIYHRLEKENNGKVPLTNQLHCEITNALKYNNPSNLPGRKLRYKKDDLDEYNVTITFRYLLQADMAVKMTDTHGGEIFARYRSDSVLLVL